jgi:outer membrane protein OmpA-like peptidoglycan-associated protein
MTQALRIVQTGLAVFASTWVALAQSPQGTAPDLISKSTTAIGYQVGGGSTKVDLKRTGVSPQATGEAKVEAKKGISNIEVSVKGLAQPSTLGTELLTYVLWVVSSDGRASNVGEIQIKNSGEGALKATTQLQTFSLLVTVEPYFSVRQPNEIVVLENALRKDTKGRIFPIQEYKLMKRAQYQKMGNPLALTLDLKSVPLEVYEARNAVEIAKSHGAEKYAPEIFTKADAGLQLSENALGRKADKKEIISLARSTVQSAEDARALAVQRQDEERITMEREAAAAKAKSAAEAKAAAEAAEAKRRTDEEARRQAELAAARQAQLKAEADAAATKAQAEADALRAKEESAKADAARARHAAEQLRAQLLGQLNRILETKDTPRGLVVTMADVLFDTGKYDLRPPTREKLARLSGIILAHPGLNLEIEGHTDSTGSDELNQKLSEQRSSTVRSYLVDQGLSADTITSKGLGKAMPVADNGTAAGRQRNRRVEIIVEGEVIGSKIGR